MNQIPLAFAELSRREVVFGRKLFADPAWDILLELYLAALSGEPVNISQVCNAAAAPNTTALRWIGQLEKAGLISRERDASDGRRFFIQLSAVGRAAMDQYFRSPHKDKSPV